MTVLDLGTALQQRRRAMELSLADLTRLLGGSPGESYLSRVERGIVPLSPEVARKAARALRLPEPLVLNAAGHLTDEQVELAVKQLTQVALAPSPRTYALPVLAPNGDVAETRRRLMTSTEDAFLMDLTGAPNEPYVGEALVLTGRDPVDGIGVIALVDGTLSAWTYRRGGKKEWIENGRGEKRGAGYEIRGVIARVATERTFVD